MSRTVPAMTLTVSLLLSGSLDRAAMESAFPGAEGFGSQAMGCAGGRTVWVTSLGSDGPGGLRGASTQVPWCGDTLPV